MTMATFIKKNISLVMDYSFRSLVQYHHGAEHGGMQGDVVLKKELRVLHSDLQVTGSELRHTFSNKTTPPNSDTPYEPIGQITFKLPHLKSSKSGLLVLFLFF